MFIIKLFSERNFGKDPNLKCSFSEEGFVTKLKKNLASASFIKQLNQTDSIMLKV